MPFEVTQSFNRGAVAPVLPAAFLWTCRLLDVPLSRFVLTVSVSSQEMRLFEVRPGAQRRTVFFRRQYRVSTSRFGTGQQSGSNRTPLGLHRVAEKIGGGYPAGTVFESRRAVGFTWQGKPGAPIAHRILWLEGLEPGFNRGGNVDSHARYIYIHGLGDEPTLGRPASRGCIHMAGADLMPLFDRLPTGTLVWIGL
ncbi:MAG: L,D-transpeptidase family protein [Verrucomicrobiia bacterium]